MTLPTNSQPGDRQPGNPQPNHGRDGDRAAVRGPGLRSSLPERCRRFARALEGGAADDHAEHCARCRAYAAFRAKLPALLRALPPAPAALTSPALLEATQERIVEGAANALALEHLLGRELLAAAARTPTTAADDDARALPEHIVAALSQPPRQPTADAWAETWSSVRSAVQRTVVAESHTRRAARLRVALMLGVVGAAASAILGVTLSREDSTGVTIEFADLDVMPMVDYAVLRSGIPR